MSVTLYSEISLAKMIKKNMKCENKSSKKKVLNH